MLYFVERVNNMVESKNLCRGKIPRRTFLKGSAAMLALGAAWLEGGFWLSKVTADPGKTANEEVITYGVCRGDCLGHCPMRVHVRDGHLVKTSKLSHPIPEFERICQRGLTHVQRIYAPDRLLHPLRRAGKRGEGKWEQITWEEAIAEICTKWKSYQQEFGPESIAFSDCAGNSAIDSRPYTKRLFNLMGSVRIDNSFDNSFFSGIIDSVGESSWSVGDDERNLLSAKYIFAWGSNLTEAGHVHYAFINKAKDLGAKLIVIDPNYTIAASKADKFVPIRPGTDAVLAMSMLHVAIAEKLTDKEMLERGTVAPFLVKKSDGMFLRLSDLGRAEKGAADAIVVRGADGQIGLPSEIAVPVLHGTFEVQGHRVTTAYDLLVERVQEWTPERAAEICDIPAATIRELARMYAEGPTTLCAGYGPDHYANGQQFYYAVMALVLATGQIGRPGAGLNGHAMSSFLENYADIDDIVTPPEGKQGPVINAPLVPEAIKAGKYGDMPLNIKSLYVYDQNLLGNQTHRTAWLEALEHIDLFVVADVTMNDTSRYADIVLPVAHYFETDTYDMSYSGVAVYNAKAVEPLGEAKGDFEIVNMLGCGMGMADKFSLSRDEFFRKALDNEKARAVGLSWEKLKQEGYIYTLKPETPIYMHGAKYEFSTDTKRGEFYRENVAPVADVGKAFDKKREALPCWNPPYEAWQVDVPGFPRSEAAAKYPLVFTSKRPKFRVHTQYSSNPWLLELWKEPVVTFHPHDAEKRGIRTGDVVKIFNDRGYVVVKAAINPANRPGVLVIDHGWQKDDFIDGHYSDLSSNKSDVMVTNNAFFDCVVEAVKQ